MNLEWRSANGALLEEWSVVFCRPPWRICCAVMGVMGLKRACELVGFWVFGACARYSVILVKPSRMFEIRKDVRGGMDMKMIGD